MFCTDKTATHGTVVCVQLQLLVRELTLVAQKVQRQGGTGSYKVRAIFLVSEHESFESKVLGN